VSPNSRRLRHVVSSSRAATEGFEEEKTMQIQTTGNSTRGITRILILSALAVPSFRAQAQTIANAPQAIPSPVFINLYWDAHWDANNSQVTRRSVDHFTEAIARSSYFSGLQEYGVQSGSFGGGFIPNIACRATAPNQVGFWDPFNDSIAGFIQCELDHEQSLPRGPNVVYNVLLPISSTEHDSALAISFCQQPPATKKTGWHYHGLPLTFSGTPFYTIVMMCGDPSSLFTTLSHEMVEVVTDPSPIDVSIIPSLHINLGIFDNEIADICDDRGITIPVRVNGNPVTLSSYWLNSEQRCFTLAQPIMVTILADARELALSAVPYTDYGGDGLTDIAFHQPGGNWVTVPILFSRGGPWLPFNNRADFANQSGVVALPGRYRYDGLSSIALHNPGSSWNTVPVLFSNGDGTWDYSHNNRGDFANQQNVIALPGDYNGDGLTDIAFYRPDGVWNSVPVLFANGDGTWRPENFAVPVWANQPGVYAVPGDYDGDGKTDIAFYKPGGEWGSVQVLFSNGDGSWRPKSFNAPLWANQANVMAVPGDFNRDGRADLAFYNPNGPWGSIPVMFAQGMAGWTWTAFDAPTWANAAGVIAVPGDFDGDGFSDIAFYNPSGLMTTLPVLYGHGQYTQWTWTEYPVPNWVNQPGVKAVPGFFNTGCTTDVAFYRPGGGWATVPVVFSRGETAAWLPTNNSAKDWANQPFVIGIHGNATGACPN
jgi:hypothetical protein